MATTNGADLTELERRAESTRAELAHTVDELQNRVSPDAIRSDVRDYARDTGQHMLQSVEARVRENPLQAMAIAALVAYPLFRLAGKIPAPLLVIGAGVALSRRNGSDTGVYGDESQGAYRSRSRSGMPDSGSLSSVKKTASNIGSQISEKTQDAMERVRGFASEKAADASDLLSRTYRQGRDAARSSVQHAGETYGRTRDSLADTIERHPVMAGGIAFAIGTLLAASLAATRQENRTMGSASDDVKRHAEDLASEGLDRAGDAAQQAYRSAAEEMSQEGLTPEAARRATRAAMDTAREAVQQPSAPPRSDRSNL